MPTWTAAALLALAAASTPPLPAPDPGPELVPPAQVVALPAELRERLHARVTAPAGNSHQRLERLIEFTFDPDGLGLEYGGDHTYTAGQLSRAREANCLSFALLFVALAREAGLDAYVQETDHVLSWYEGGGTVYNASHVNAGVRVGGRRRTVDINRNVMMMLQPPRPISDERALSRYYNNRGAELLEQGQLTAARAHMKMAIDLAPDYPGVWSNLGVLSLREGDLQAAEAAYGRALAIDSDHAATLFNLVALHQHTGNARAVAMYRKKLHKVELHDPFHQFMQALQREKEGDFEGAVKHYRQAIKQHEREHHFHFGLARAYVQLGDKRRARASFARARDLAAGEEQRSLYQAKIDGLLSSQP
jgi:Flp pilus assembly protein TadD